MTGHAFALLASVAVFSATVACTPQKSSVARLTPAEAEGLIRDGSAVLIDVREDGEIERSGMAASAIHMPMSKVRKGDPIWKDFLDKTPKDRRLIFYCRRGGRANEAAGLAVDAGFGAANMGGFDDWQRAKLPTRKLGEPPRP